METSPVFQSISGLCFTNQVCPTITSVDPRLHTENMAHSVWSLYRSRQSYSSLQLPPSFGVPSMLYTGIARSSFLVVRLLTRQNSVLINIPVAPQSTSPVVDL